MPEVDAPVAACRIWLRSMASAEFEPESRESKAESELMSFCLFLYAALNRLCAIRVYEIGTA
jgi:hypothetical protein